MGDVSGFTPSANGLHFENSFPDESDLSFSVAGVEVPLGNASDGLCGGFVYTVIDLFNAKLPPPPDTTAPGPGTPLFEYLVARLIDSFDLPAGPLEYLALMDPALPDHETTLEPLGHGRAWRMINEEWPKIQADVDAGRLSPLGVVEVESANPLDLGKNHQLAVWGYTLTGTQLTLKVYDPNHPDVDDLTLSLDIGHPEHTTHVTYNGDPGPIFAFFRTRYTFRDPSRIAGPRPAPAPSGPPPLLRITPTPWNPPFDTEVVVNVHCEDADTGEPVHGAVLIDGVAEFGTNDDIPWTFHREPRVVGERTDIYAGTRTTYVQNYPAGSVSSGAVDVDYPITAFEFGDPVAQESTTIKVPRNIPAPKPILGIANRRTLLPVRLRERLGGALRRGR